MRQYGFYVVWGSLVIGLIMVSIHFQPTSGAMVAEVRSEITTVSFEKPIRVEKIHVVPGQEIKKGDLLVETVQSKMKLDLHQKQNDIEAVNLELQANESEFSGRVRLLKLETEGKIARLQSELLEEKTALNVSNEQKRKFSEALKIQTNLGDTVSLLKIRSLENEINQLEIYRRNEQAQLLARKENQDQLLLSKLEILKRELAVLTEESVSLKKYADSEGVIGNVFVEKDELVAPYGKILNIYESNPTMIVAYLNEKEVQAISPGIEVLVESQTRGIKIKGKIQELGSRVTRYPESLNTGSIIRYGQEVFIDIPPQNNFLNGEKVLVYLE